MVTEYSNGLQMATQWSSAINTRRRHSMATRNPKNRCCTAQPRKEMALLSVRNQWASWGAWPRRSRRPQQIGGWEKSTWVYEGAKLCRREWSCQVSCQSNEVKKYKEQEKETCIPGWYFKPMKINPVILYMVFASHWLVWVSVVIKIENW